MLNIYVGEVNYVLYTRSTVEGWPLQLPSVVQQFYWIATAWPHLRISVRENKRGGLMVFTSPKHRLCKVSAGSTASIHPHLSVQDQPHSLDGARVLCDAKLLWHIAG